MDAVHILWLNLMVQLAAILACAKAFCVANGRLSMIGSSRDCISMPMIAEGRQGSDWHMEPLTQALTELSAAKAQIASFEARFVTKEEFSPVKRVVYGMVSVILTTAMLSILVLIWKGKQ